MISIFRYKQVLINTFSPVVFQIRKMCLNKWQYFLWNQKTQLRELKNMYYRQQCNHEPLPKRIVYMANGYTYHGGIADRIKAILLIYSWCKQRNIDFKIHFVHPFSLQDYLSPNDYNWMIDEKDVYYDDSVKVSFLMLNQLTHSIDRKYKTRKIFQWMDKEWTDYQGQIHVYTNAYGCQDPLDVLFSSLFKINRNLSDLLSQTLINIGSDYVTISLRFTTLLGDFQDCINSELKLEEQNALINQCIMAIEKIVLRHSDSKVVVTSDSEKFLKVVEKISGVIVLLGKIGHTEHSSDDAIHLKTLLDFFVISNAKKVYLLKSDKMYKSGFAKTAALIGNKPFELIEI